MRGRRVGRGVGRAEERVREGEGRITLGGVRKIGKSRRTKELKIIESHHSHRSLSIQRTVHAEVVRTRLYSASNFSAPSLAFISLILISAQLNRFCASSLGRERGGEGRREERRGEERGEERRKVW